MKGLVLLVGAASVAVSASAASCGSGDCGNSCDAPAVYVTIEDPGQATGARTCIAGKCETTKLADVAALEDGSKLVRMYLPDPGAAADGVKVSIELLDADGSALVSAVDSAAQQKSKRCSCGGMVYSLADGKLKRTD